MKPGDWLMARDIASDGAAINDIPKVIVAAKFVPLYKMPDGYPRTDCSVVAGILNSNAR